MHPELECVKEDGVIVDGSFLLNSRQGSFCSKWGDILVPKECSCCCSCRAVATQSHLLMGYMMQDWNMSID